MSFGPFGVTTPQSPSNPKHKPNPKTQQTTQTQKEDVPKQTHTTTNKKNTYTASSSGSQRFDA